MSQTRDKLLIIVSFYFLILYCQAEFLLCFFFINPKMNHMIGTDFLELTVWVHHRQKKLDVVVSAWLKGVKDLNLTNDRIGLGERAESVFSCQTLLVEQAEGFRHTFQLSQTKHSTRTFVLQWPNILLKWPNIWLIFLNITQLKEFHYLRCGSPG